MCYPVFKICTVRPSQGILNCVVEILVKTCQDILNCVVEILVQIMGCLKK